MSAANPTIQRLLDAEPLRRPVIRAIVASLDLPAGSRGLDVGCGIGLQAHLLAEAVGPAGHVTGVDLDPSLLAHGRDLAARAGLDDRISFEEAHMDRLPFAAAAFDWAWSADCVGYPVGTPKGGVAELVRVVRPGGSLAILGWSGQQVLPGHPLLEARLNASSSAYLSYLEGAAPERHFARALGWLQAAGLEAIEVRTFVGDVRAPVDPGRRTALASLLAMLWTRSAPDAAGADGADRAERDRLCDPDSPDFVVDEADYHAFFTYTVFRGRVPAAGGREPESHPSRTAGN